eukprot:TRINITY_DN1069_c0_g2_i2.p1 TRINITY_DN1069_c0_g2~~TRINITY_DN1069_c0_g2_i2.p1  ORF type:complete len:201 (-),score=15.32 TRINITY_DN1069_c0_g2_i2:203-805(-)
MSRQLPPLPEEYEPVRKIGSGAYGTVFLARERATGRDVAVKIITNVFNNLNDAERVLRELMLLRRLNHENVVRLEAFSLYPSSGDFESISLVLSLMDTDLHHVLASKQPLSPEHVQFLAYQLALGLHYLHSAGIIHRDLKPANILVNRNCDLAIADFGLARSPAYRGGRPPAGRASTADSAVPGTTEGVDIPEAGGTPKV